MMDWAAEHARERGAPWWKSFTTGKSAELLGGVPHDTYVGSLSFLFDIDYLFSYGMTSLGVRQYVLGIYKELGLEESQVTKVQTGGPDGDLGSSE
jgi:glutamate dehydrogenase